MLRRFTILAFALATLGGVFAAPAGATTGGSASAVFPHGVVFAGNVNNGPVHKVWTQSISAAACNAVRKVSPKAVCSVTITFDVRRIYGTQKPPAGAHVRVPVAPASNCNSYWICETGSVRISTAAYYATLTEEVAYHDYCPGANCNPQGIDWSQWEDDSSYGCYIGCTVESRQEGVINNGAKLNSNPESFLNGWENFEIRCSVLNVGCNYGRGNRLYFNGDGYWYGTSF